MRNRIHVYMYSYKKKNLKSIVDKVFETASSDIFLHLIDQHPLKRAKQFIEYKHFHYRHVFWDHIFGPPFYKVEAFNERPDDNLYMAFIGEDVELKPGWDIAAINFLKEKNNLAFVSGQGRRGFVHKDKYFLEQTQEDSSIFTLSQAIDRQFIMFHSDLIGKFRYPTDIKYYGEEELLSIELFTSGFDIWSMPSGTYVDDKERFCENNYAPFSIEHNYDKFVRGFANLDDRLFSEYEGRLRSVDDFAQFHGLDRSAIKPLPFPRNDVEYDPNALVFQDTGGERFIAHVTAIY